MPVENVTAAAAPKPLFVTNLALRRAEWASTRQAVIAGNIANADTPRYKAHDVGDFQADFDRTRLQMAATNARHMQLSGLEMHADEVDSTRTWDVSHSANTVSLDEELMKADETARHHQLSVSVMGAFHRMLMTSVSSQ
ncbi:MAG: flagellar basal body rod protein FlgB [Pseudomonadota bacterium]